jgi:hypothetical protein
MSFKIVDEVVYTYANTGKPVSLYANSFIVLAEANNEERYYEIQVETDWASKDTAIFGQYVLYVSQTDSYDNAMQVAEKPWHYYQEILQFWLDSGIHNRSTTESEVWTNFEYLLDNFDFIKSWELEDVTALETV